MSYTPTVWRTGDKVTSAKLNKLEQGVANAGSDIEIEVDSTLTQQGKPADAKAVGDALANIDIDVDVDTTLTQQGVPADAKSVGDAMNTKLAKPTTDGTNGQVLTTDGQGGITWGTVQGGGSSVDIDDTLTQQGKAADSKAVGDKIGEINNLIIDEEVLTFGSFTQGSLSDSTGAETNSTNTIRTGFIHSDNLRVKMTPKEGWKAKVAYYESTSTFTHATEYKAESYVIELNDTTERLFRICVRNSDYSDITPADVPEDAVILTVDNNKLTQMTDDVVNVKDNVVNDFTIDETICGGRYNQGTLSQTTGENVSNNYYIRTSFLELAEYYNPLYPIVHIEPSDGYKINVFIYHRENDERVFDYCVENIIAPYDIKLNQGSSFRVSVGKIDGSTISNYTENTQNLFTLTFKRNKSDVDSFETSNVLKNEKFVPVVSNEVGSLYHYQNIFSGNGYIDYATGEAQVFSSRNKLSTTRMIDVSKFGVLYYSKAGYTDNPGGMAFYDADGVYITGEPALKQAEGYPKKVINDVTYEVFGVVKVPKNAVFARFTCLTGESNGRFYLFGTYRSTNELNESKFGFTTVRNDKEKVTEFLNIAKTYLPVGNAYLPSGHNGQDTLGYGYGTILSYDQPLQTVADKWDIDCSTFVGLALRGYTYEETSYPTQNWVDPSTWVANPNVEWAINPYDWKYPIYADWIREPEETRSMNYVRTAAAMCQWMVERGWEVPIDSGLANLEAGDIIFYSRHNSSTNDYIDPDRYKLINHVAICMTKEAPPSTNWDTDRFHYRHRLIDVRTRNGACGTDIVENMWDSPDAIYSNNVNTIICVCRPDLH